jgi:flagellin
VAAQAYSAAVAAVGIDGKFSAAVNFQIGATAGEIMTFDLAPKLNAMHDALHVAASVYNAFGIPNDAVGTDLTLPGSASASIGNLDQAIAAVAAVRSEVGAAANRLGHVHSNLSNMSTSTRAASGRIIDTDFAVESAQMTSSQMLFQTGTGMLQRSNGISSLIIALLRPRQ